MKKTLWKLMSGTVLGACVAASAAHAAVVLENTRVIFPSSDREVTVKMKNQGDATALVQVWIDNGDPGVSPEKIDVPFTITPTIFRLDPTKGQSIRVIYTKEPLSQDKETLFWLNALEVPPKAQDAEEANRLQIAFRTRIKFLFRPKGLKGDPGDAPAQVKWAVVRGKEGKGYALKGTNPTPYFVNLGEIKVKSNGGAFSAGSGYIAPGESSEFPIDKLDHQPEAGAEVGYLSINDYGAGVEGKQPLGSQAAR